MNCTLECNFSIPNSFSKYFVVLGHVLISRNKYKYIRSCTKVLSRHEQVLINKKMSNLHAMITYYISQTIGRFQEVCAHSLKPKSHFVCYNFITFLFPYIDIYCFFSLGAQRLIGTDTMFIRRHHVESALFRRRFDSCAC